MNDSLDTFIQARRMATGSHLSVAIPDGTRSCNADSDFRQLVQEYHTFLHEGIGEEIVFLINKDRTHSLEKYRQLIYNLRTTFSHQDNPKAEKATACWRRNFNSYQEEADALFEEFSNAMELLARLATKASRDEVRAKQWQEIILLNPDVIFKSVESDLGFQFTPNNRNRMVKLVQTRLKAKPVSGDRFQGVADYCAQQMLSERKNLPTSYTEVLDRLGLLGDDHARSALELAYSIARVHPALQGDDFLNQVEHAWRTIQLSPYISEND